MLTVSPSVLCPCCPAAPRSGSQFCVCTVTARRLRSALAGKTDTAPRPCSGRSRYAHPPARRSCRAVRRCKRAFWQRRHRDRVGVVRREIPPAVHLRAAGQAERVRRCRARPVTMQTGFAVRAERSRCCRRRRFISDAVVFRTSGRRPVETDLLPGRSRPQPRPGHRRAGSHTARTPCRRSRACGSRRRDRRACCFDMEMQPSTSASSVLTVSCPP